ncbi:hypothetical protein [Cytophaga aurantiaca]|uniref:hypothetical protein n=1 Tax=Cytophaga aurantiaca TaxID=29530 RepID=UPI0003675268|nr:hypothetical protein [Cytophaga aurantiaca]
MKNKISLSITHNNAKRMEYFLNRVKEELVEVHFDWRNWKNSDQINDGCKFISVESKEPVTICILFCDSYHDANRIGKANELPCLPTAKWSVNGDVMYFVESNDADKVSDILSLFAGEE